MGVFDEELRAAWGKLTPEKRSELRERYYQARLRYLTWTARPGMPRNPSNAPPGECRRTGEGQYVPHVIEPSAGVDRLILALIANAFHEEETTDERERRRPGR